MNRRYFLGACLVAFYGSFLPTSAATPTTELPRLAAGEILRGRFRQARHLQGFDQPIRSEGRFALIPEQGLIWQVETPFAVDTVIGARGLLQRQGERVLTQLAAADLPGLAQLYEILGSALIGDWQALEANFAIEQIAYSAQVRFALTPQSDAGVANAGLERIELALGEFVDQIQIFRGDDDFDLIDFFEQSASASGATVEEQALIDALGS